MGKDEDWYNEEESDGSDTSEQINEPQNYEFDFAAAEENPKIVITSTGRKDSGKTTNGMSFIRKDKRMVVIQFDGKASRIHKYSYNSTPRVIIHDGNKHWDSEPNFITETAYKSIMYVKFLLNKYAAMSPEERPHYVMIDGFEVMQVIAEMAMRYNNRKKPFEGFKNRNLWKERRQYIKAIHKCALDAALEGVIYTIYLDQVSSKIENGEVIESKEEPKWFDVIKLETDITLHCFIKEKDGLDRFFVKVLASKIPPLLKTGTLVDVTDSPLMLKGMPDIFKDEPKKSKPKSKKIEEKKEEEKAVEVADENAEEKVEEKVEKKPKKEKTKPKPEPEVVTDEPSDSLKDPHPIPEHTKMVNELHETQKRIDQEVQKTTEIVNEKYYKKAKTLILETMHDDFSGEEKVLYEDLKIAAMKTKLISEEGFQETIDILAEKGEITKPRMGYIGLPSETEGTDDDDNYDESFDDSETETTEEVKEEVETPDKVEEEEEEKPVTKEPVTEKPVTEESESSGDEFDDW